MSLYDLLDGDFRHVYDGDMRETDSPSKGYLFLPQLSYGHWGDSCEVEMSNVRVFIERHKLFKGKQWILVESGGGGVHVGVSLRASNESILSDVMGLMDYPALDDVDCSQLAMDLEDDAWWGWVRDEFLSCIVSHYGADHYGEFREEELIGFYRRMKEQTGTEGYVSGREFSIDVKGLRKGFPKDKPSWLPLLYW